MGVLLLSSYPWDQFTVHILMYPFTPLSLLQKHTSYNNSFIVNYNSGGHFQVIYLHTLCVVVMYWIITITIIWVVTPGDVIYIYSLLAMRYTCTCIYIYIMSLTITHSCSGHFLKTDCNKQDGNRLFIFNWLTWTVPVSFS